MVSYTDGSWSIDKFGNIIAGGDILSLGGVSTPMTAGASKDEAKANARRIVVCVNFCAGISTENLEGNEKLLWLAEQYNAVKLQRDELLAALEIVTDYAGDAAVSLRASSGSYRSLEQMFNDGSIPRTLVLARNAIAKAKGV